MNEGNLSTITEFFIVGFGDLHNAKILVFTICLIIHIMALTANILVITLVGVTRKLHSPMYFFLSQLSLSELLFTTNIVPTMLWLILMGGGKVSIARCIAQFFMLSFPTIAQCMLLAAMSFDRYAAICRPLHYTTIMTLTHQIQMVISCWVLGLSFSLLTYVFLRKLKFCDRNVINHFACDTAPLMQLACSDTSTTELVIAIEALLIFLSPFTFIVVTYVLIIRAILRISSSTGRQKAFSTCSSHLMSVFMYYGTLSCIYIFPPKDNSVSLNKGLSVLYTLVTPLLNPFIYTLRNQHFRAAIYKYIH